MKHDIFKPKAITSNWFYISNLDTGMKDLRDFDYFCDFWYLSINIKPYTKESRYIWQLRGSNPVLMILDVART